MSNIIEVIAASIKQEEVQAAKSSVSKLTFEVDSPRLVMIALD
jgi:hypothetical protein